MHQLRCCRVLQKSSGGGVALSSLEKKKPVVLFFYPKVCTASNPCCLEQMPSACSLLHTVFANTKHRSSYHICCVCLLLPCAAACSQQAGVIIVSHCDSSPIKLCCSVCRQALLAAQKKHVSSEMNTESLWMLNAKFLASAQTLQRPMPHLPKRSACRFHC